MQNQRHKNKDERRLFLEKYTSHFIVRLACKRELGTEQRLQHIDLPNPSGHSRVSFLFSWTAAQPEGRRPTPLGSGLLYRILSPTGLQTALGVPRAPSAGWWLSLPHLVSNSSDLQLTEFLSSPSYMIVHRPLNLWNGLFDRHQAEITVMQFTGLFRCISL